jgi:hypothetical protein
MVVRPSFIYRKGNTITIFTANLFEEKRNENDLPGLKRIIDLHNRFFQAKEMGKKAI